MDEGNGRGTDPTALLREGNIARLVLRFSATTLAALLLNAVYTLTDALFVSWGVGVNAMGGVSIVFPFVILQGAIASAVGSGAASLVSRRLGEGKSAEAGEITCNAMAAFYGSAILITILGFAFLDPMLRTMGVTGDLYAYARQYLIILLAGNIFSTGFSSIIRAEGKMLYALLIWVVPISLNLLLDAIFILGLGWGVTGSALATVIGQFVSFCMSILFFVRFSAQRFKGTRLHFGTIGEILAIGLPSLVQMGSLSVISLLLNNVLGQSGGTAGVNTFAYISKIITFVIVPFTALAQALAPIAGYNYGAGQFERVQKTIKVSLLYSFIYALLAFSLLSSLPETLLRLLTDDADIIAQGARGLRIIAFAMFGMPLPVLAGAAFQAIGQKLRAFVMYAANLIFMVPALYLASALYGVTGIWWAYAAANGLASLFAVGVLWRNNRI